MLIKHPMRYPLLAIAASTLLLTGCQTMQERVLDSSATGQTSVELRAMQSRSFDTSDKQKTMRTVIATLQDLGFVVDKADLDLGSISATKLSGYALRITVNVRPGASGKNMIVRANAQYNVTPSNGSKALPRLFCIATKIDVLNGQ
jgi:hypothetical protein